MKKIAILLALLAWPAVAQAQLVCVQKDLTAPLSLTLTWTDNATNETGQIVERKLNNGPYAVIAAAVGANIVSYTDSTVVRALVPNTYTYRVSAFNTANGATSTSLPSNEACAMFAALPPPPPPVPQAPSGLTLSAISSSQLQASWEDTPTETQYKLITVGQAPPRTYTNYPVKDATSFIVGGLPRNKTFCTTIAAMIGVEASAPSNKQCATTQK